MKKRGEITVFLSLTLVCILSLFMGLLESARTAGARLYLTMAANSAMASVMSQYNRNLWDMYHLLFLEYESPEAIARILDRSISSSAASTSLLAFSSRLVCLPAWRHTLNTVLKSPAREASLALSATPDRFPAISGRRYRA